MGFTAFKNNYISRVNGEGFATSADSADFIVSEYLGSFNVPGLTITAPAAPLVEAVNVVFNAGDSPTVLETKLTTALSIYWLTAVYTGGYTTLLTGPTGGGTPTTGNIPEQAESVEDFVDGLVSMFEDHISGITFSHPTSPPILGSVLLIVP